MSDTSEDAVESKGHVCFVLLLTLLIAILCAAQCAAQFSAPSNPVPDAFNSLRVVFYHEPNNPNPRRTTLSQLTASNVRWTEAERAPR